ncbi:MAG: sigma-70 family RNA polymerase sigma factor [Chloroflexi bacterium]|nr:sigma-70 family RNA polymerase sigma factor [Chloroflexota bacterium]
MAALSDNDLVQRTRQGDADAYGALVLRHQNAVFNVCLRLLGDAREAEDLAQDAFIRGYRHLDSFDNQRPFGPWIRRIATNLCLNHLKRRKPPTTSLMDELDHTQPSSQSDPVRALVRDEQERMVREAILSLPPHYRAVIELRHFQDLSYAEIAETLHLSLSDVRTHLYRARKALKKHLSP